MNVYIIHTTIRGLNKTELKGIINGVFAKKEDAEVYAKDNLTSALITNIEIKEWEVQ